MAVTAIARRTFVTTRISRRSSRSTYTPATADSSTAGTRNVRISALTAEFERVDAKTIAVSPYSTMFPPIWLAAWASRSSRNGRFRRTAIALSPATAVSDGGAAVTAAGSRLAGPRRSTPGRHDGRTRRVAARAAGARGARVGRTFR